MTTTTALTRLLCCSRSSLPLDDVVKACGLAEEEVVLALASCELGTIADRHITIDDSVAASVYASLGEEERREAHLALARSLSDAWLACEQAALAGSLSLANAARERAEELPTTTLDKEQLSSATRALRAMLELRLSTAKERSVSTQLCRVLMQSGDLAGAQAALERCVSRHCRRASDRRLWAQLQHRQGQYENSLRITKSLLAREQSQVDDELVHLHAKNLMLAGHAEAAVRFLDRRLSTLGATTTIAELELYLTRERAAREAGSASRLGGVARIFKAGKHRRINEIQAMASFGIAVELSHRGRKQRAIRWFERALEVRIAEGNAVRAAEIENSLGIVEHELGLLETARSRFVSAIARLNSDDTELARVVVLQNFASLQLDQLELDAAKTSLEIADGIAAQGVLGLKTKLLLVECGGLSGAAADLLLARLDQLETGEALERPATAAYANLLRARLLASIGDASAAQEATSAAVRLLATAGRPRAACDAECEALAWTDRERRRHKLAGLLLRHRHDPPPRLAAATAALQRRSFNTRGLNPLEARRCRALWAQLSKPRGEHDEAADTLFWEEVASCVAQFSIKTPEAQIARICSAHLGASDYSLLRFAVADTPELICGSGTVPIEDSVRAKHDTNHLAGFASLLAVTHEAWTLTLAHRAVSQRFGRERRGLAERFLKLISVAAQHAASDQRAPMELSDVAFLDGRSKALASLRRECMRVARTGLHVGITGESGSGKDRLARFFHSISPQRSGPVRVVDCASIAENLVESELFGHERGAFTGAGDERVGLLEACAGGILVLDEPQRLPRRAQVALASALESREIRRLGSSQKLPIDVRLVSLMTQASGAREDQSGLLTNLRYRLIGYELKIPPLRQRTEDLHDLLPALVAEEDPRIEFVATPSALAALRRLPWPGNVAELRNRVRTAMLFHTRQLSLEADALLATGVQFGEEVEPSLMEQMREIERGRIRDALLLHNGHRGKAADFLKISRRWLHQRMRVYEIDA